MRNIKGQDYNKAMLGKRKGVIYHLVHDRELYLMVSIGIVIVFIFSYLPLGGLIIAFKDYNIASGFLSGKFVGLKYFSLFFSDPYFLRLIRNTVLLSVYSLCFSFPIPIIFAMLLNELASKRYKKFVQSASYLPYFISTVVIVGILLKIFSSTGLINVLLVNLGFPKQMFFNDPQWFRPMYILSEIWTNTGYSAIIYLAVLSGVSTELYEAAIIDGANRWQKAKYITFPSITPMIRILLILALGNMMRVGFDKVFLMSNPSIYETADIITTYIYRRGLLNNDFSYATAVGLFNSVISLFIVYFANLISKKVSHEGLF